MTPSVGRIVHYVSHGTPVRADGTQAYTQQCRAAIITAVDQESIDKADLCVLNPTGLFFNQAVPRDDGGETPGDPNCPQPHGAPFRYCPQRGCGWSEAALRGGTWHWPERVG